MKKYVRYFAVLVMTIILCTQVQVSAFAAGTGKNNAVEVTADSQINYGTISEGGANDWYCITQPAKAKSTIQAVDKASSASSTALRQAQSLAVAPFPSI